MIKAVIFDFFGVLEHHLAPNREVLDYIQRELKPNYKIGVVSNVMADYIYLILSGLTACIFLEAKLLHSSICGQYNT